ncbi:MAG: hypothetical protein NVSMB55_22760 [Mycobacteriales bacterium]
MNRAERKVLVLEVELGLARSERDRECAARIAAVAEVQRLRETLVRLEARLDVLETTLAARTDCAPVTMRGLASLIVPAAGAEAS